MIFGNVSERQRERRFVARVFEQVQRACALSCGVLPCTDRIGQGTDFRVPEPRKRLRV